MGAPPRSLVLNAVGVVAVLALAGCGGADGVPERADGSSGGTWEATISSSASTAVSSTAVGSSVAEVDGSLCGSSALSPSAAPASSAAPALLHGQPITVPSAAPIP